MIDSQSSTSRSIQSYILVFLQKANCSCCRVFVTPTRLLLIALRRTSMNIKGGQPLSICTCRVQLV
ncbi:unnamed protein product [Amoebophrya sp. A25]|nr:unnamed protein product [Amoebophrya sp. A25]|eukprot:GSA25T00026418001.1